MGQLGQEILTFGEHDSNLKFIYEVVKCWVDVLEDVIRYDMWA